MLVRVKKSHRLAVLIAFVALMGLVAAGCGFTTTVRNYWDNMMDSQDTGLRKRVVVAPFVSRLPHLQARAQAVGKAISQRLEKKGGMVLVDFKLLREELAKVNPAIKHPEERIVAAAMRLGLNTVLTGSLTNLAVKYNKAGIYGFRENEPFAMLELDMKLIDVATGVLLAEHANNSKQQLTPIEGTNILHGQPFPPKIVDELQADLVVPAINWVSKKVSAQAWTGFILAVDGKRVQVTVGRDTGLSVGDMLVVYGKGESIRSGSGRILTMPGPPVAKLKLVKLEARTAWTEMLPQEVEEEDKDKKEDKDAKEAPKPLVLEPGQALRTY